MSAEATKPSTAIHPKAGDAALIIIDREGTVHIVAGHEALSDHDAAEAFAAVPDEHRFRVPKEAKSPA